jgi:hypothetical protein
VLLCSRGPFTANSGGRRFCAYRQASDLAARTDATVRAVVWPQCDLATVPLIAFARRDEVARDVPENGSPTR